MEPTKAQKNALIINKIKETRKDIDKIIQDIQANHNARETNIMITDLEKVDGVAIKYLQKLGLSLVLEDKNER